MQRTNSLNNIQNITSNRTLRRFRSSPSLIESRERLQYPVTALQQADDLIPVHNTLIHNDDLFINLGTMNRHLTNIGIETIHIDNIIWGTQMLIVHHDPRYLQHDLFEANILHRAYNGLLRASEFRYPETYTAPTA